MKKMEPLFFSFYDKSSMERHLEKMAKKGWMLEHIGNYAWRYKPCTPCDMHFTVTYDPSASAFAPEPSEAQQTMQDFAEHSGWHLAASNASLLVFASEDASPVPIHTDPEIELELMERIGKRYSFLWIFLLCFSLFSLHVNLSFFRFDRIGFYASPVHLASTMLCILLFVYAVADALLWLHWRKKARQAVQQNEALPRTKGASGILSAILLFGVVFLFCLLIAISNARLRAGLILISLSYGLILAIVNAVHLFLKRRKASAGKNLALTLTVDVIAAAALCALCVALVTKSPSDSPAQNSNLLCAPMLTGVEQPGIQLQCTVNSSFLVTQTRVWALSDDESEDDAPCISYRIVDVHFAPLYDSCFRRIFNEYNQNEPVSECFVPADAALWHADRAWQLEKDGSLTPTYLLCRAHTIAVLAADWPLSEEQMAIAGDVLLNRNEASSAAFRRG